MVGIVKTYDWSGRWDLNPRPLDPQLYNTEMGKSSNITYLHAITGLARECQSA